MNCFDAINEAKAKYLNSMGDKLKNTKSGPKAYWKILNKLLNKKMPCPQDPSYLLEQ